MALRCLYGFLSKSIFTESIYCKISDIHICRLGFHLKGGLLPARMAVLKRMPSFVEFESIVMYLPEVKPLQEPAK